MVNSSFHLRWLYWAIGAGISIAWATGWLGRHRKDIERELERSFLRWLSIICGVWFLLAVWGKYSQLTSLSLHAQDFWLFVDILEQMKNGGAFLTRFAPHAVGWVQHGVVHPMFSWALFLPLAYGIGSVNAALLFNPTMLAGAGFVLGILLKRAGRLNALFWVLAFLFSTQVGKVDFYEVHPEAAYPLAVFLWIWAAGWGGGRVRLWTLIAATLFGAGVKEDAFLIFLPLFCLDLGSRRKMYFRAPVGGTSGVFSTFFPLLIALLGFFAVMGAQWVAIQSWSSGAWGPATWFGAPVLTNATVGQMQGVHWAGPTDAATILSRLLAVQGGIFGGLVKWFSFLLSRPWLSLVVLAPWVIARPVFWVALAPLTFAYAMLEGPNHLWNYYSAPFLGSFWWIAASASFRSSFFKPDRLALWAVLVATFLGSSSPEIMRPGPEVAQIRQEIAALLPNLGQHGWVWVADPLLSLVPFDRVWSERAPMTEEHWKRIDFILFLPHQDAALNQRLRADPAWTQVGAAGSVALFKRPLQK